MASSRSLIDVLLDRGARWDERDDAATDLGGHDAPEVIDALRSVANDPAEDVVLRETCRDSLREIADRAGQ